MRLVWALVHAKDKHHVRRGYDLAKAALPKPGRDKDYRYLWAGRSVGCADPTPGLARLRVSVLFDLAFDGHDA